MPEDTPGRERVIPDPLKRLLSTCTNIMITANRIRNQKPELEQMLGSQLGIKLEPKASDLKFIIEIQADFRDEPFRDKLLSLRGERISNLNISQDSEGALPTIHLYFEDLDELEGVRANRYFVNSEGKFTCEREYPDDKRSSTQDVSGDVELLQTLVTSLDKKLQDAEGLNTNG